MSIPLDNLYHFVENVAKKIRNDDVIIYHFSPHGSKNLDHLIGLRIPKDRFTFETSPWIICYDQEPLNYSLYENIDPTPKPVLLSGSMTAEEEKAYYRFWNATKQKNIQFKPRNLYNPFDDNSYIYDKILLLHSEKRSFNVERYRQDRYIPTYYWSHALISLDWFRFVQHVTLTPDKQCHKTFLIYNRAWSGTREYRVKFADMLCELDLVQHCHTSFNPKDFESGIFYQDYEYKNSKWRAKNVLENYFQPNNSPSTYSATIDFEDYNSTDIEVVLETLFDDSRLHLTEKSLRPISCGQPFILCATHGSLEYLKQYGFKTFSHIWNEDYDKIEDPSERLLCITNLMKEISNWTPEIRLSKLNEARKIAQFNKKHFFSKKFFNQVVSELQMNLFESLQNLENNNTSRYFLEAREFLDNHPDIKEMCIHGIEGQPQSQLCFESMDRALFYASRNKTQ